MPIFEYICEQCGHEFELLVFRSDEPKCATCGASNLRKKMSSFGFSSGEKSESSSGSNGSSCGSCSSSNCSSCGH